MIVKMILQTASVTYQSIETQLGNHNNSFRMTLLLVSLIISQFRQASVLVHNFGSNIPLMLVWLGMVHTYPHTTQHTTTTYHSADLRHVNFDTSDKSMATFVAHHPTELGINPSNWVNGCGNYNRIYVREDNGIVHEGDAGFVKTVINSLMIQLHEVNLPDEWSVIRDDLARLVVDDGICPLFYGREAIK